MLIYLRQTPSIKLPFGSDCWDCRYVCRHPAGYSDWVRASLRFTNKFLNIANKNSPPKTKACSISCCMMYSCQSSVWFFATRGWLSDLSSLGNARKDASNGSIQNPSIHPSIKACWIWLFKQCISILWYQFLTREEIRKKVAALCYCCEIASDLFSDNCCNFVK